MAGGFGINEAISALVGAGIAFATNAIAEKIARHRSEADRGNGALLTLSQMYSQLQNTWRQVYEGVAADVARAGRKPQPFEILPLTKTADDGLRLNLAEISFLLRSHDPDLPNRLATIEGQFLQHRESENERTRLALEMQEAFVRANLKPGLIDPRLAEASCGPALWNQLVAVTLHQFDKLPNTIANIVGIQKQLRNVLRLQFPMRRFIKWEPRSESELAGALAAAESPPAAWWRTQMRANVDAFRKWHAKKKVPERRGSKVKDNWDRAKDLATILSLLAVPVVLTVGGWMIQQRIAEEATKREYVQIALSILRDIPGKEGKNTEGLREWAVQVVEQYAPVKLSAEARKTLLKEQLGPAGLPALSASPAAPGGLQIQ